MLCAFALGCAHEGAFGGGPHTPSGYDPRARQSLRIPGGEPCLVLLKRLGVEFERLGARGRIATPVQIASGIAGIRYSPPLICDCRLALALHWSGPVLAAWNISRVEHFGAYANRTTRGGRPSLHAMGLALDAASFQFAGMRQSVSADYARGLGAGCWPEAPAINQVVCHLRGLGLFRELITPDHDADHHDHVHLAIAPL